MTRCAITPQGAWWVSRGPEGVVPPGGVNGGPDEVLPTCGSAKRGALAPPANRFIGCSAAPVGYMSFGSSVSGEPDDAEPYTSSAFRYVL
jgi:hypothetical protein